MNVLIERFGGAAVVTLNSPSNRNALSADLVARLTQALSELASRKDVGALVIAGGPRGLCSGMDTEWLASVLEEPLHPESFDAISGIYGVFAQIREFPAPTISVMSGVAIGAGLNIVLSTDLCVVTPGALLRSGFSANGVHPGGAHFSSLTAAVGRYKATAVGLFNEDMTGAEFAAASGAILVENDEAALGLAIQLAKRTGDDPQLARHAVAALRTTRDLPPSAAADVERVRQLWSYGRRQHTGQETGASGD